MKVNLDQVIYDMESGKPINVSNLASAFLIAIERHKKNNYKNVDSFIQEIRDLRGGNLTLGIVFRRCLLFTSQNQQGTPENRITPEESQRRFTVAQEMMAGGTYEIYDKDLVIIKDNMMKIWDVLVSGQVMNILYPKKEESAVESTK